MASLSPLGRVRQVCDSVAPHQLAPDHLFPWRLLAPIRQQIEIGGNCGASSLTLAQKAGHTQRKTRRECIRGAQPVAAYASKVAGLRGRSGAVGWAKVASKVWRESLHYTEATTLRVATQPPDQRMLHAQALCPKRRRRQPAIAWCSQTACCCRSGSVLCWR